LGTFAQRAGLSVAGKSALSLPASSLYPGQLGKAVELDLLIFVRLSVIPIASRSRKLHFLVRRLGGDFALPEPMQQKHVSGVMNSP
jgi:hypothetical protein